MKQNPIRACVLLLVLAPVVAFAAEAPPEWAYPAAPSGFQPPPDDGQAKHVPGSTKAYTEKQIGDAFNPPDWNPDEHPPLPEIVAHGKKPDVNGCALCHLTMGYGHPESANIAGLPPVISRSNCTSLRTATAPACCRAARTT